MRFTIGVIVIAGLLALCWWIGDSVLASGLVD
jgi:hypothetical protein